MNMIISKNMGGCSGGGSGGRRKGSRGSLSTGGQQKKLPKKPRKMSGLMEDHFRTHPFFDFGPEHQDQEKKTDGKSESSHPQPERRAWWAQDYKPSTPRTPIYEHAQVAKACLCIGQFLPRGKISAFKRLTFGDKTVMHVPDILKDLNNILS